MAEKIQAGPGGRQAQGSIKRVLYRPLEAAEAMGTSKTTIYDMVARGELSAVRIGKSIRIPVAGIDEWLRRQPGSAS